MPVEPSPTDTRQPPLTSLRVCIVAENASFRFGGEASLPLHYFSRLRSRGIEAWLVVHSRTRNELQTLFPGDQDRIEYIPDRWYHKLIWRLGDTLPRRLSTATFGMLMVLINQLIQRHMIRRLVAIHGINVIHQPIPVSPKAPSLIFGLAAPVIMGPMNGGMNYPDAFRNEESLFTRGSVALARLSATLVNMLLPGKRRANVLLVANERSRLALPGHTRGAVIELPENGVDLSLWSLPPDGFIAAPSRPRFVFVGRLVDWKRLDLVLSALVESENATLDVIGDGPMRGAWGALAAELGVAERVNWLGWLPQPQCATCLHGATALLLPSIYECGGAVVLEAMACGVPVVALAWGGPAEYIDASCGFLIPPSSPESIIRGFSDAQRTLSTNPDLRARLGLAGRKHVEMHFDWEGKIDRILGIYRKSVAEYHA